MRILIGCEESQTVTKAFRRKGHDAFSCDIKPTRGRLGWHYQADIFDIIDAFNWDFIGLHPPCTHIAVSGNRYYSNTKERHDSIEWTKRLWEFAISRARFVYLENPVSVIFPELREYKNTVIQYIQPWQFGHGEVKKTGLALHNLPELYPSKVVEGRVERIWRMPPGPNRQRDRSKTYPGIAKAMANQWTDII
jgi:hypothetical protein